MTVVLCHNFNEVFPDLVVTLCPTYIVNIRNFITDL